MIRSREYNKKNPFWNIRLNKNNLLKNPVKGGTPANEKRNTVKKNK